MEEIYIKYIDWTKPLDPAVIVGLFYIDYCPTMYSMPRDRRAFTLDGRPVTLGNLRYAKVEDDEGDSHYENIADHVDFLNRPSIWVDMDPTLGQGGESRTFKTSEPRVSQDKYKWPNSPCWNVLDIDRTKLPDNDLAARIIVTQKFRELTKKHHPDLGGSHQAMRQLIAAREEAEVIFQNLVTA